MQLPALRAHRRIVEPGPKSVFFLLALLTAGVIGNFAVAELYFNIDFIFGSIATLIILYLYGPVVGILAAALISVPTIGLWNHSYAFVTFIAEAVFVASLLRERRENLVILDALFWLVFGIGMAFAFYQGVMGLDFQSALVIAFKQALNGIANALVAGLIITLFHPVRGFLSFVRTPRGYSLRDLVFYVIVAFVLVPAIFALVLQARTTRSRLEEDVQRRLVATGEATEYSLNSYFSALADGQDAVVDAWEAGDMADTDSAIGSFVSGLPWEIYSLRIFDEDGARLAGFPGAAVFDAIGEAGEDALSTAGPVPPGERRVSNVFTADTHAVPMVSVARPWRRTDSAGETGQGSEFAQGHVVSVVGLTELVELLRAQTDSWTIGAAVLDGNDDVVASTEPGVERGNPFERFSDYRGARALQPGLRILLPDLPADTPAVQRWEESMYVFQHPIAGFPGWRMVLYSPLGPHRATLTLRTAQALTVAFVVVVLTIVLAHFLSLFIVRSIRRLSSLTSDLPRRVIDNESLEWPRSGVQEVQQLIENFRETSDLVRHSVQQLREANGELSRAKHSADAANRAKSRFLANVSHDLRTPLNGILGYAQLLRRDTSLSEENREAVSVIERSGSHLLMLLNDILDLSRIEADRVTLEEAPLNVRGLIDDQLAIARIQVEGRGITIRDYIDERIPEFLSGDEKKLRQVLMNLLSNAVKFTSEGAVSFRAEQTGDKVRFSVSDTGPGVTEEDRKDIFSPFWQAETTSRDTGGTGLGLAIVKRLVEVMGGEIQLDSEVGVGSTFWFEIPMRPASSAADRDGNAQDAGTSAATDRRSGRASDISDSSKWVYDSRHNRDEHESPEHQIPEREHLELLYEKVRKGDMKSVAELARSTANADPAVSGFCERVLALASGFYLGELKDMLSIAMNDERKK